MEPNDDPTETFQKLNEIEKQTKIINCTFQEINNIQEEIKSLKAQLPSVEEQLKPYEMIEFLKTHLNQLEKMDLGLIITTLDEVAQIEEGFKKTQQNKDDINSCEQISHQLGSLALMKIYKQLEENSNALIKNTQIKHILKLLKPTELNKLKIKYLKIRKDHCENQFKYFKDHTRMLLLQLIKQEYYLFQESFPEDTIQTDDVLQRYQKNLIKEKIYNTEQKLSLFESFVYSLLKLFFKSQSKSNLLSILIDQDKEILTLLKTKNLSKEKMFYLSSLTLFNVALVYHLNISKPEKKSEEIFDL
ncbi:hypothetical protein TCON_0214 [Astathelohania contejeani]|uniref:Uncharacterized protein n=1 Tax=Astathelohania contejeani TaxID=164912 RepID=A0ABQ7I2L8_9MICR|nr:hypothetical protein TCON_0214 [Thelohania contejeani]